MGEDRSFGSVEEMINEIFGGFYAGEQNIPKNSFLVQKAPPHYNNYDGRGDNFTRVMSDSSEIMPSREAYTLEYRGQEYVVALTEERDRKKGREILGTSLESIDFDPDLIYLPDRRVYCSTRIINLKGDKKEAYDGFLLAFSKMGLIERGFGTFENALSKSKVNGGFKGLVCVKNAPNQISDN